MLGFGLLVICHYRSLLAWRLIEPSSIIYVYVIGCLQNSDALLISKLARLVSFLLWQWETAKVFGWKRKHIYRTHFVHHYFTKLTSSRPNKGRACKETIDLVGQINDTKKQSSNCIAVLPPSLPRSTASFPSAKLNVKPSRVVIARTKTTRSKGGETNPN